MKSISQTAEHTTIPRDVVRIALATALAGASFGLQACNRAEGADASETVLSGNIEVVDAQLGFRTSGRVIERLVSEGERIEKGQLVARLDDVEQQQQLAFRRAELDAETSLLRELKAGSRPQEIASAEATLRSAEAERDRLRLDFTRAEELRAKEVIAARDYEISQAQLRVADARTSEAEARLRLIVEGPRKEAIDQAAARVKQAEAAVALAQTQLENTRVTSPLSGVVLSHHIEAGEYVSPGTAIVTVGDDLHPWVRAFVDQTDLGKIRRGQSVTVRTDSFPDKVYRGTVSFISAEAEFTPKTVQTTKERAKLVYRIKVEITNENDELKPGMPADVVLE